MLRCLKNKLNKNTNTNNEGEGEGKVCVDDRRPPVTIIAGHVGMMGTS